MIYIALIALFIWVLNLSNRITRLEGKVQNQNLVPGKILPAESLPFEEKNTVLKNAPEVSLTPQKMVETPSDSNTLAKIGIAALVLGMGFFFKYSIDQGWISEWGRVMIGLVVSVLMVILGLMWKKQYGTRADLLSGGGIAIAYFSIFAGHNFYDLYGYGAAILLYIIISAASVVLAFFKDSRPLASVGILGAFFAPLFFGLKAPDQSFIIIYLSVLSLCALGLFVFKQWFEMPVLSLVSSLVVFASWVVSFNKLENSLYSWYFSLGLLIIYLFGGVLSYRFRKLRNELIEDAEKAIAIIAGIAAFQFFAFSVSQLSLYDPSIRPWATLLGGVLLLIAYVLVDRLEPKDLNYTLTFFTAGFFISSIVWQFGSNTEIILILALSVLGFLSGFTQKRTELRIWSLAVAFFALAKSFMLPYEQRLEFLVNIKLGLTLLSAAVVAGFAILSKYFDLTDDEKKNSGLILNISILALWVSISWDISNSFSGLELASTQNILMTLWWVLLGVATLALGRSTNVRPLKRLALFFLGLGIIKAFLYDVWALDMVYRIVAFIVLGIILLSLSFVYNRDKEKIAKLFE